MRPRQAVAACIACTLLLACPRPVPAPREAPRVLLLGIDSATLVVIDRLVDRGELPTFSRLMREGAVGPLQTIRPTLSVIIWTSIVTGHRPEEHGIHGWLSESGEQLAFSSEMIRKPPLWRILTAREVPSAWVGFWASWPAEQTLGAMVSNRMKQVGLPHRASPPALLSVLDAVPRAPSTPVSRPTPEDPLAGRLFLEEDLYAVRLALAARKATEPRLLAVYLRGLDICQHSYWHTVDPEATPRVSRADEGPLVEAYYRYLDGALAELMATMPGAAVVVVSDHGMEAIHEPPPPIAGLNMNKVLEALGHLTLEPHAPRAPGERPSRRPVVWASTRAYTFGDSAPDLDRGVRINLAGRDPHGIVPPAEQEALLARLKDELAAVATPDGRRLFPFVEAGDSSRDAPDLRVTIDPAVTFEDTVLVGGTQVPVAGLGRPAISHNSGQHWDAPPGMILLSGSGIRRGVRLEGASVYDVAPTVLSLLGLPPGADMAGKSLAAALEVPPPAAIPTYGDLPYRGPPADGPAASEETLEELRDLGYVQ